mmetsp:Transcript_118038/g.345686  ORF Transcript_118038/g.345686 Transcript_118038/m.345686 type:complete len:220 (+) Transcript_118038:2957-3616(+)
MASARRMMRLPGVVETSKTSASSSKGRSSRVPLMGPRQKIIMSLCLMNVVIHVEASSKPNSGGSSVFMPVSCTKPGVLTGQVKPRAASRYWSMTLVVSVIASSSFLSPVASADGSASGISNSMIRAEPSAPSSPSTIMSEGLMSLPNPSSASISDMALVKSASGKPGSITQKPLESRQATISMLTPDMSEPLKTTSYSVLIFWKVRGLPAMGHVGGRAL